jgi:hypothetical protein
MVCPARFVFGIEMDAQKQGVLLFLHSVGCKTVESIFFMHWIWSIVASANSRNFALASQNSRLNGLKLLHLFYLNYATKTLRMLIHKSCSEMRLF